jgi:tetratricopeptide (TPR) repeat protein
MYVRPDIRALNQSERNVRNSLQQTVSLHFRNATLTDVTRHLATTCGINIVLDAQAIQAQGLTVNQQVSIDVDSIALRSALNVLMAKAGGLVYVIDDNVLKITTPLVKASRDIVRPQFGQDPRYFCDLMSHAPGLNTSRADVLALAEEQLKSQRKGKDARGGSGSIDESARKLIARARSLGWEEVTFPAAEGAEPFLLRCDGAGRYAYSRVVSEGLREEVLCDGEWLQHAYSDIGLASKRAFSRFHRRTIESLVPWLLPSVEELARGADVMLINDRTVAIVSKAGASDRPAAGASEGTKSKKPVADESAGTVAQAAAALNQDSARAEPPVYELHLVFGDDGRLVERRFVDSESKKVVLRTIFENDGTVRLHDADDEEVAVVQLKRKATEAPPLDVDESHMVVLPMPIRSSANVLKGKVLNDDTPDLSTWSGVEVMELILADMAEGNGTRVARTINAQFFERGDRRDALYVLLSRFPAHLKWEEDVDGTDGRKRQVDLRPSPEGSPVRQFVRQYISWMLNSDGSATEFAIEGSSDGFVQRMAIARNLYQRWSSGAATNDRTNSQIKTELQRTLDFVASCRTDAMGWTLLSVIHPKIEAAELNEIFADVAVRFEDNPQLAWLVRQERVKALFKAGRHKKARRLYTGLLRAAVRQGAQPRIAADIREQFVSHGGQKAWSELVEACGTAFMQAKLFRTAFLFSAQLRQLGDVEQAGALLDDVLAVVTADNRPDVTLLAVEHLRQLSDGKADDLMDSLLDQEQLQKDARVWRYAARVADDLGHRQTALRRLEYAIDLEFRDRPDVIDVEKLRAVYTDLLTRYEEMIDASTTLETAVPEDTFARIIRAADQWRSLEDDTTTCCHLTARVLAKLNQTELAWSYLTTPLAGRSGESASWRTLAVNLTQQEQVELAGLAWSKAFEFEQTNPELLLSHAKMLAANGHTVGSRRLLKQIVDSNWQPRFNRVQQQARNLLH